MFEVSDYRTLNQLIGYLRSSLPSLFLRLHAQHELVVRRNIQDAHTSFDVALNVIAIIRLGIDRVTE